MRHCKCGTVVADYSKSGQCKRCWDHDRHLRRYVPRPRKPSMTKLIKNLRRRTKQVLRGNYSFSSLLGCGSEKLREHLESQFKKGMCWENYGSYWVIDHIKPISKFGRAACHYSNLQPLTKEENARKGDK